jgi:Holliday junction resolvasome RuvABC endonuclease subunit
MAGQLLSSAPEGLPVKCGILALDLGTKTGWAICAPGGIHSGVWDLKPDRFSGAGMRFVRLQRLLGQLPKPGRVVFEEVRRHVATDAAHAYGGFMATLTAWCEEQKIPYEGIPVGTIKKFATGKGNADKGMMIAAAMVWGHNPADDNEADALALLHYAMRQDAEAKATA